nr:hypothetical protein [Tanacetum cinerariifolium]
KEDEWNKIIHEKGSDLIKMLETVEFELHVQEPFFSQLKDGQKTVEGRSLFSRSSKKRFTEILRFVANLWKHASRPIPLLTLIKQKYKSIILARE